MIAFPDPEDRSEIDRTLCLDAAGSVQLWRKVAQLVNDINRHETFKAEMAQGRNRKEWLSYIKILSNRLTKLEIHLLDRDPNTDTILRRQLGETLGELLSHQGFEQLIQTSPGYSISSRFPSAREDVLRDDGLYRAYEQEMLPRRISLAQERTSRLLIALAHALNEPLARLLEIERQNEGGAPGKLYRNYVIQELAPIYQNVHGKLPTTTPGGGFVTMCELVLGAIGLETDGVEKAVGRVLGRIKALEPIPRTSP
jgi:hypothetical protein